MIVSCFAMVAAVGLDLASLCFLAQGHAPAATPAGFAGLHGTACVIAALAIVGLLPATYDQFVWAALLFFLLVSLCIPLLGMVGLALGLVPALWRQRQPAHRLECLHSNVPASLTATSSHRHAAPVGDGRLMGILLSTADRGSRLHALIATLSLEDQQAVPLLRIGLKDRDDDVRLLAYSLLTRKEKALEERIGKSLILLDQVAAEEAFAAHRALARDYWELAGLGNAGSAVNFMLECARLHAQAGATLQPTDASLQLLLGRILLKEEHFALAHTALLHALSGGVAFDKVAPFLAEIAFYQRRLNQIGMLLPLEESADTIFSSRQLSAYWNGASHAS